MQPEKPVEVAASPEGSHLAISGQPLGSLVYFTKALSAVCTQVEAWNDTLLRSLAKFLEEAFSQDLYSSACEEHSKNLKQAIWKL